MKFIDVNAGRSSARNCAARRFYSEWKRNSATTPGRRWRALRQARLTLPLQAGSSTRASRTLTTGQRRAASSMAWHRQRNVCMDMATWTWPTGLPSIGIATPASRRRADPLARDDSIERSSARWIAVPPRCWCSPRSSSCSPASCRATCCIARSIWSDELASILFLWLAMLGSVIAFRRGEHMRMTALVGKLAPAARRVSRGAGHRRRARLPACSSLGPAFEYAEEESLHHHPGAGASQHLARQRPPGRHRADDGRRPHPALPRRHHRDAPPGAVGLMAAIIAAFWLLGPVLEAARQLQPLDLLRLRASAPWCSLGVPIAFSFALATFGYLALTTTHADDGHGRAAWTRA